MKYVIQVMLGIYAIVFVIAALSLVGCSKYHDQSVESPKRTTDDVRVLQSYEQSESESESVGGSIKNSPPILDDNTDLSEMQEFQEADLVEDLPIKIYHVTFYT